MWPMKMPTFGVALIALVSTLGVQGSPDARGNATGERFAFANQSGRILSQQQSWGSLQFDREVTGGPLRIGSKTYETGLGTHAESRILVEMPANSTRLSGVVGVTPNDKGEGAVIARIIGDGHDLLFQSGTLQANQEGQAFAFSVSKYHRLEFIVAGKSTNLANDHTNWVKLQLDTDSSRPADWPSEPVGYHLERLATSEVRVHVKGSADRFSGRAVIPIPPDDLCQKITVHRMGALLDGQWVDAKQEVDRSDLKQPVAYVDVPHAQQVQTDLDLSLQFFSTSLVSGAGNASPNLTPQERNLFLQDMARNDITRANIRQWMTDNDLWKRSGETDLQFARRALGVMGAKFRYQIPDNLPDYVANKSEFDQNGDSSWVLSHCAGECWRLSEIYNTFVRLNGIPARLVSGNWVHDKGHHLRSLIFLKDIGWVPVEATGATGNKMEWSRFFGHWGGTFLAGNRQINLQVPLQNGQTAGLGTFDQWWFVGKAEGGQPKVWIDCPPCAFPNNEGLILSSKQGWGSLHFGFAVNDAPLVVEGRSYGQGLGTHANGVIRVQIPPGVRQISGLVGIPGNPEGRGAIIARVSGPAGPLYTSPVLRAGGSGASFAVSVNGLPWVELACQDAGVGLDYEHVNWVNLQASRD